MSPQGSPDFKSIRWFRLALRMGGIAVTVYLLHLIIGWTTDKIEAWDNMPLMVGLLVFLLLTYALLMAVPFAPGIEIGISLLMLRGAEIAPFVYLATLLGLSIAFMGGRYIRYAWLHAFFRDMGLMPACRLLERIDPLDRKERLALLEDLLPAWLRPLFAPGRYLMLALLLNLPGNALIGGGGGIAFISGLSRLYGISTTLIVMALAVLPVPLLVWLHGAGFLTQN